MLAIIAISLTGGIALRTIALDRVPPGLHADEAVEAYDAYCLLKTGRDHHGNLLPVVAMQSFNDYRKPLFIYSLIPIVATFGLTPRAARMGAALWGAIDLIAMTAIAGLTMGLPGAAAAAMFAAVMPWHLSLSRFGIETTSASALIELAMLCFLGWGGKKGAWLLASAVFFGLSLYAYPVTELFLPMMLALLAAMYWKQLINQPRQTLVAMAIVIAFAAPQAFAFASKPAMTKRFQQLSIFSNSSDCLGCRTDQSRIRLTTGEHLMNFAANWASHFTPSFLFIDGDRGDHWTLTHLPGFGQLLPVQAPLMLLGLSALAVRRRRKFAVVVIGWLVLATLTAAMLVPLGADLPEPGTGLPTPSSMLVVDKITQGPITPGLLMAHPDSRHAVLAMAPFTLLSVLGLVTLLDFARSRTATTAVWIVLIATTGVSANKFLHSYFHDYPTVAAPYFAYGTDQLFNDIEKVGKPGYPVFITGRLNQGYIYLLFLDHYPPDRLGTLQIQRKNTLFGDVDRIDRYHFYLEDALFQFMPVGVFVYGGADDPPSPPVVTIRYPDGKVAYNIVVK